MYPASQQWKGVMYFDLSSVPPKVDAVFVMLRLCSVSRVGLGWVLISGLSSGTAASTLQGWHC